MYEDTRIDYNTSYMELALFYLRNKKWPEPPSTPPPPITACIQFQYTPFENNSAYAPAW